ncbi:translation initiation factor IF-3 [Armatimonas rosea]|uniref:Translation initiation factor IF-3 n=1 Tax=Armatimonas rosea TaxID=685828 RepID=A0A7W9W7G1_ARMRO|nr:translation initiation factor IF-3 [Armatimonas rosea]MBB6052429.1 translation initiation factor IF-3 [Armatimonas rosea]
MGPRVNERIRVREIRVVGEDGEQLGVMTPREALDIARSRGMDLIEVAPTAVPPVCRIMDYGKFKYEQGKREREARQKQRQSDMKGITISPKMGFIDDHDLDIKIRNCVKFLGDGDKVKITFRFRSRWMSHPEFAQEAMAKIAKTATDAGVGQVERHPLIEGRQMIMILAPSKEAMKRAAQRLESRNAAKAQAHQGKPGETAATKPSDEEDEDEEDDDLLDDEDDDLDDDEDDEDEDEAEDATDAPAK